MTTASTPTPPLVWGQLWDAMKANPDTWVETTGEMYMAMLNVLPPKRMTGWAFLVGEPDHDNAKGETVYAGFKRAGDRYFARYLTVRQFSEI